jgi:hypothetical protein
VAGDGTLRLTLAPGADEHRITGQLRDEQGEEHSFASWLGLLSLLDAARARAHESPDAISAPAGDRR